VSAQQLAKQAQATAQEQVERARAAEHAALASAREQTAQAEQANERAAAADARAAASQAQAAAADARAVAAQAHANAANARADASVAAADELANARVAAANVQAAEANARAAAAEQAALEQAEQARAATDAARTENERAIREVSEDIRKKYAAQVDVINTQHAATVASAVEAAKAELARDSAVAVATSEKARSDLGRVNSDLKREVASLRAMSTASEELFKQLRSELDKAAGTNERLRTQISGLDASYARELATIKASEAEAETRHAAALSDQEQKLRGEFDAVKNKLSEKFEKDMAASKQLFDTTVKERSDQYLMSINELTAQNQRLHKEKDAETKRNYELAENLRSRFAAAEQLTTDTRREIEGVKTDCAAKLAALGTTQLAEITRERARHAEDLINIKKLLEAAYEGRISQLTSDLGTRTHDLETTKQKLTEENIKLSETTAEALAARTQAESNLAEKLAEIARQNIKIDVQDREITNLSSVITELRKGTSSLEAAIARNTTISEEIARKHEADLLALRETLTSGHAAELERRKNLYTEQLRAAVAENDTRVEAEIEKKLNEIRREENARIRNDFLLRFEEQRKIAEHAKTREERLTRKLAEVEKSKVVLDAQLVRLQAEKAEHARTTRVTVREQAKLTSEIKAKQNEIEQINGKNNELRSLLEKEMGEHRDALADSEKTHGVLIALKTNELEGVKAQLEASYTEIARLDDVQHKYEQKVEEVKMLERTIIEKDARIRVLENSCEQKVYLLTKLDDATTSNSAAMNASIGALRAENEQLRTALEENTKLLSVAGRIVESPRARVHASSQASAVVPVQASAVVPVRALEASAVVPVRALEAPARVVPQQPRAPAPKSLVAPKSPALEAPAVVPALKAIEESKAPAPAHGHGGGGGGRVPAIRDMPSAAPAHGGSEPFNWRAAEASLLALDLVHQIGETTAPFRSTHQSTHQLQVGDK
jgi:hypothetical protein